MQEASPRYVESLLHHEWLKCVTTGERYFLESSAESARSLVFEALSPQSGAVPAAVRAVQAGPAGSPSQVKKSLPDLVPGLEVRLIHIEFEMESWRDTRTCVLRERYARVFPGMRYGDLFFESASNVESQNVQSYFTKTRHVDLYWDGLPEHSEAVEDLMPAQQETAYMVPRSKEDNLADWAQLYRPTVTSPEEEDLELAFPEGLKHFHLETLPPDRWYIFENRHSFLIVGNLVFFTLNLYRAYSYLSEENPIDYEADGVSFRALEGLGDSSWE